MTWEDCPAGWVSATLWPAYLKMGNDENGDRPATIAFGRELHTEMIKLTDNRQYTVKGKEPPKDSMMGMHIVCDEALAEGEFEMRWA